MQISVLLKNILDLSRQLIAADAYAVWRFLHEGEEWRIVAAEGLSDAYQHQAARTLSRTVTFDHVIVAENVETSPELKQRLDGYHEEGICALLVVPLFIHGQASGSIGFYYHQPRSFGKTDVKIATTLANMAGTTIENVELYQEQTKLNLEAQKARDRLAFLAESSNVLASSLDYEKTLNTVANLTVPYLGEWCGIDMLDKDGNICQLAVVHGNPKRVEAFHELRRHYPIMPGTPSVVSEVMQTGRSKLFSYISPELEATSALNDEHLRLVRNVMIRSLIVVPLTTRGQTLGTLSIAISDSDRRYGPDDLALAEELARRAATAIDNARLYHEAQAAKEELSKLNLDLEQRVTDRTAELEAFGYSVSHDLRAPLRAINGFVTILQSDHGTELDQDARRLLSIVQDNTRYMSTLIDDLLTLSRLGRQSLNRQTINLTDFVQRVYDELEEERKGRQVEFTIGDLPPCSADPALLKQVFINLLSNALKFTRNREVARIEVSCTTIKEETAYFVKDNGVGFDMAYAHKLFTVFQRLHNNRDYEGTGVGLAIVARIIQMHGGRVWTEAEVDKGATFYFTLGK